jgi:membrane associated rhomboid family serine protease
MLYVVRTLHVPAKVLMLFWFVLQDVVPILLRPEGDTVAHWAHIGGFLSGLLLMSLLVPLVGRNDPPARLSVQERYPHRTQHRRW